MGQDNQEFINKAKDSLEELAGKTKKIFGDIKERAEMQTDDAGQDQGSTDWSSEVRKHAAGEFEYQTRNQYQYGSQTAGGKETEPEWAARYSEQQPVSDFTELGAVGGEPPVGDAVEGSRADYGTEAVYGDPTGRYDGNEANMLSDGERQARYEEQEPVDIFPDEIEGPDHPDL